MEETLAGIKRLLENIERRQNEPAKTPGWVPLLGGFALSLIVPLLIGSIGYGELRGQIHENMNSIEKLEVRSAEINNHITATDTKQNAAENTISVMVEKLAQVKGEQEHRSGILSTMQEDMAALKTSALDVQQLRGDLTSQAVRRDRQLDALTNAIDGLVKAQTDTTQSFALMAQKMEMLSGQLNKAAPGQFIIPPPVPVPQYGDGQVHREMR